MPKTLSLCLFLILITGFVLSACNSGAASGEAESSAIVVTNEGNPAIIPAGRPVQLVVDLGEAAEVVRLELWARPEGQETAQLIWEGRPDERGVVSAAWTPAQAGPATLELRLYDGRDELQGLVVQEALVLEAATITGSEIEATGLIEFDIPDRIVEALLPRILDRIQIGDEPIVISTRAIIFFLYLMLFLLLLKIISNILLNWAAERRAAQLAEIDLGLRQLDFERVRLEFIRQQQELEARDREEAAEPYPPAESGPGPLSPTERRRLQYLRQQNRFVSGAEATDRSLFPEIMGGAFLGGSIGLISGLILTLIIVLLRLLLGNRLITPAEDFFPGLVLTGLYLGLLIGLGSGLLNVFSNRSFFSAALRRTSTGFSGGAGWLLQPNSARPGGSLGRATLGGITGVFYGVIYGLLVGIIGAGLVAGFALPGAGDFPAASQFLLAALASGAGGAVVGGVIGGVSGIFYGLFNSPQT